MRLKIDHTYRVAALCEQIARSIPLTEEQTDHAWLAGLLHDVGRFEQLRRYGTFEDAKSIDHAACSRKSFFCRDTSVTIWTTTAAMKRCAPPCAGTVLPPAGRP